MNFLLHFPLPSISSHRHVLRYLSFGSSSLLHLHILVISLLLTLCSFGEKWRACRLSELTFREVVLRHRSDDGLKLETLALETRYGDQFTLLTKKPDYLVIPLY